MGHVHTHPGTGTPNHPPWDTFTHPSWNTPTQPPWNTSTHEAWDTPTSKSWMIVPDQERRLVPVVLYNNSKFGMHLYIEELVCCSKKISYSTGGYILPLTSHNPVRSCLGLARRMRLRNPTQSRASGSTCSNMFGPCHFVIGRFGDCAIPNPIYMPCCSLPQSQSQLNVEQFTHI